MLVLPDWNAGFVHVPKTGGEWVTAVLSAFTETGFIGAEGESTKHGRPIRERKAGRPRFVFTFLRHPVAWLESWWRFQTAKDWVDWEPDVWHPTRFLQDCAGLSFREAVKLILRRHPGCVTRLFEWFTGPDCRDVDFVGRTEHLATDLATALQAAEVRFDPALLRDTPPQNASDWDRPDWEAESLAEFHRAEQEAIRLWQRLPILRR